jgi:hypothetical protein
VRFKYRRAGAIPATEATPAAVGEKIASPGPTLAQMEFTYTTVA